VKRVSDLDAPTDGSRRKMLRWLALAGLAGGMAVVGLGSLVKAQAPVTAAVSPQSLRVKVVYFQMSQSISVEQEYFELQAPAHVSDLMAMATRRHPSLSGMEKAMLILTEGVPYNDATVLRDGDEVDLIPTLVGG
jgi:molybdopterin converting factor small subunit